jgi:hypothetical protein
MRKSAFYPATLLMLGIAACTPETPLQSGGSGLEDASIGTFGTTGTYRTPEGCLLNDYNCQLIYNDPGGGD